MLRQLEMELAAPFPVDAVSWRVGNTNKRKIQRDTGDNNAKATKGQALAYIDARDVMARLDEVCGVGGWQSRYSDAGNGKTCCEIGLEVNNAWIWKSNGAGDSQIEADKGAFSDAFKRAAVLWGVGRYLYDLSSPWVELDDYQRITKDGYADLKKILVAASGEVGMQTPSEGAAMLALCNTIRILCTTPEECQAYRKRNSAPLRGLRKSQQDIVRQLLDGLENGFTEKEQAA